MTRKGGWSPAPLLVRISGPLEEADLGHPTPSSRARLSRAPHAVPTGQRAASVAGSEPSTPKVYRYHPKRRVPPSLAGGAEVPRGRKRRVSRGEGGRGARGPARLSWARACARARPARATPWSRSSPPSSRAAVSRPPTRSPSARARSSRSSVPARSPAEPVRDRGSFRGELAALVADFESLQTAEFLITAIEVTREAGPARPHDRALRPRRRGQGRRTRRARRPLADELAARRGRRLARHRVDGPRRTCAAARPRRSSARRPRRPSAANASFRRQLVPGVEEWAASLDGALHAARRHGARRGVGGRLRRRRPGRRLRLASPRACRTGSSATTATARSRT